MKEILIALYFALHFGGAFLGIVIALHLSFWLGISMSAFFIIKFCLMIPSVEKSIWFINIGFNAHCVIAHQNPTNGLHKCKGFALIVDSIWFLPIMAIVGLAIIYWFDKTWALISGQLVEHKLGLSQRSGVKWVGAYKWNSPKPTWPNLSPDLIAGDWWVTILVIVLQKSASR